MVTSGHEARARVASSATMRKPGSGSITRRGDGWRLIVDAGTDPITGKRRQMTRTVRGTRKDAEKAMAQLLTDTGKVGSGSPEGAFAAPVGSVWLRTDGGAGTSFYVKESGSGDTGWVAK